MERDNANEEEEYSPPTSWEELSDADRHLHNAIADHDALAVQQGIQDGFNVNSTFEVRAGIVYTATPLILAVSNHDGSDASDSVVRILLDKGADPWWKNSECLSAMFTAISGGHLSIVEMLLNHDNGLHEIANQQGWTPLFVACYHRQNDIVRLLLSRGANVNATDAAGMTALMRACIFNNLESTRLLLADGRCDVEARDDAHITALHCAAFFGLIGGVRALLEHNANMEVVDKKGNTPFDLAGHEGRDDIVDFLLQLYASKVTHDHEGLTLHVILCSAKSSFAAVDDDHDVWHPPLVALAPIRLPLGKLTLEHFRTLLHYFDTLDEELIRNQDESGKLPIHIACEANAPVKVLALLVEMGPKTLHIADDTGSLPLHLFCCSLTTPPEYGSARYLVEQGGVRTLDVRNEQGALPLHNLVASANPPLGTVQYLIKSFSGAVTVRTDEGLYPFMVAACDTSSASLSVIYELIRENPNLIVPNVPAWYMSWIKVVVALWPHAIPFLLGLCMSWLLLQIRHYAPFTFDPVLA